ncbi:hypothetical protein ATANTOWER_018037 [Ataeniobius toweri]|uniref:Uncharacterized protein n=1 Tax=Ataeniobius toweri TaxID=208326 RepID=A0ABU7B477_9TELE|nr:hypothetical protein [Ataeniobius toweri]
MNSGWGWRKSCRLLLIDVIKSHLYKKRGTKHLQVMTVCFHMVRITYQKLIPTPGYLEVLQCLNKMSVVASVASGEHIAGCGGSVNSFCLSAEDQRKSKVYCGCDVLIK